MLRILIIEDEVKVAHHLKQGLEEEVNYTVDIAYDGGMGLKLFQQNRYELILLDVILPGKNGFELCQEIRRLDNNVKIIMLTALSTTNDKVDGLEAGADDYIVKPFDFRELLARIRAVSKRRSSFETTALLKVGTLELDLSKKVARREQQEIELTAKEFLLLEFLMRNRGRVVSRIEIMEKVWDLDFDTGTNVVDVYVNILRKKIDKNFDQKLIHTRVGMGYIIDV